jgi:hypothetical protein
MSDAGQETYPPLDTLKPVAENVWIVDGPTIRFGLPGAKMHFPTRMTLIRLRNGSLFIHSPTRLASSLKTGIESLGTPAYLIGPNRLHYWWLPLWHDAFPGAKVYLAPRIREQAKSRIDFDGASLEQESSYPWDEEIATLPVHGSYMTEIVFFHRLSRTLVLTDLIENFEPARLKSVFTRLLTRFGGAQGQMPRDMRLTYDRKLLRQAVETMIGWDPENIVIAHGRWYDKNGAAELRRSFRWLLK